MRSPVMEDARRPHLMPCRRCGEANGVSAIACWKCEAPLGFDALLAPQHLPNEAAAGAALGAPEASAEADAWKPARHEGPHTLPPFSHVTSGPTANDDVFSPPVERKRHEAMWVAAGAALVFVAALAWWIWPSPADHIEVAPAADMAIRKPVASDAPAAAQQGPAEAAATTQLAPAPSQPVPAEPSLAEARRAALAALGQEASDPPTPVQPEADNAVNLPPPVQAPCTPQIAALGLCVPAHN